MGVLRRRQYPYPGNIKDTAGVVAFLKDLTKTLNEESATRILDFAMYSEKTTAKARSYLGATQSNIPDVTYTKVLFDTETYDTGSNFDAANSKFVTPVAGYYQVTGSIIWGNLTANKLYAVHIYVGGVRVASNRFVSNSTLLDYAAQSVSDIIYIAASTDIELYCYHDSGVSTEDIITSSAYTYLSVHLLSVA